MVDEEWRELERVADPGVPTPPAHDPATLWLSPRGRISRSTYWLKFLIPMTAVQIVAAITDSIIGSGPGNVGMLGFATSALLFWPGIVGFVKRLHDLDLSGWLVPGLYGSVAVGAVVLTLAVNVLGPVGAVLAIPLVIVSLMALWYTIKTSFVQGTQGPNRYGPDPTWDGTDPGWE